MKGFNYEKLETSSGVPLYVMRLPHANTVAAGVLVKAGTREEIWPQEAGLAHALEHMVFQGTKMFPNSQVLSAYLEEIGGYSNAFTSKEGTFFYCRVPQKDKEKSAIFLNELINNCVIPEEKINTEMRNIAEEIKMWNDDPERFTLTSSFKFLYQNHPLSRNGLGAPESVLSFKRQNFVGFLDSYYNNQNFAIVVAGNISPKETKELFDKHFQNQRNGKKVERKPQPLENYAERKKIERRQDIQQVQIILACPAAPAARKESLSLEMFATMIDGGSSFPLFQEVRDKRGLCYSASTLTERYSDIGFWGIYIGTDPKRYKEAIDVAVEVIQKNKSNRDLKKKAGDLILGRLSLIFENPGKIIESAAHDILYGEKPKGYDEIKNEIESISIQDVEKAVDTYLNPEDIRQILLVPKDLKID